MSLWIVLLSLQLNRLPEFWASAIPVKKEVAKIVHCGEPKTLTKSKTEAADNGGLIRLCRFLLPVPTIKEKGLEACLKKGNLKQAEHHLAIAKWYAEGAKKEKAADWTIKVREVSQAHRRVRSKRVLAGASNAVIAFL